MNVTVPGRICVLILGASLLPCCPATGKAGAPQVATPLIPQNKVNLAEFGGTLASLMALGFFWLVSSILQDQGTYTTIMTFCGSAYIVAWGIFCIGIPRIRPIEVK